MLNTIQKILPKNSLPLGTVHKRRPQSEGVVQCRHYADKGGSSDADVRAFWCKKLQFFEIYGVSARTRGGGGLG